MRRFFENCNYFEKVSNKALLSIINALIRKCLLVQQRVMFLGGGEARLVRARSYYRKIAGLKPVLGINSNYLTGTLCDVANHHRSVYFTTA